MSEPKRSDKQILDALLSSGTINGAWHDTGGTGQSPGSFRKRCKRLALKNDIRIGSPLMGPLDHPIEPPVPEGFVLKQVSTEGRSRDGGKQWTQARQTVHEDSVLPLIPDGMKLKGVTTLTGPGGVLLQYTMAREGQDKLELLFQALPALLEPYKGIVAPTPEPKADRSDLHVDYIIGDAHLALMSWKDETGENHDMKIGRERLLKAIKQSVYLAPPSKTATITNVGDFFHTDNPKSTTTSGRVFVDVDGRYPKMLWCGVELMRGMIDEALTKHDTLEIVSVPGNHDEQTAVALMIALRLAYENEPRVIIQEDFNPFRYYRFGANLIGVTHGDGPKLKELPGIMAADRPQDWGQTRHWFWRVGHFHHDSCEEINKVLVETFRTLTTKDYWHHWKGYRSGRDLKCDTFHKEWGRVNRSTVGIEQVLHAT